MRQYLRNIQIVLASFVFLGLLLGAGILWQQHRASHSLQAAVGENKAVLAVRYGGQAGSIFSRDKVTLAQSSEGKRRYAEDAVLAQSLTQLVGDYTHVIPNSIESRYQGQILGNERNVLHQLFYDISGHGLEGDDVFLTIDSQLQKAAFEALGEQRGAIVLMNYRTGEVLAMASTPAATPQQIIDYENLPDTSLFNRALQGAYFPGSTFKYVTATAWYETPGINPAMTVDCSNMEPVVPNGVKGENPHGDCDVTKAFELSANQFFGVAALQAGAERMQKVAKDFGFNQDFSLDKLLVTTSRYKQSPNSGEAGLTWMSIGQPQGRDQLVASPLHLAMMVGSVPNDGQMLTPHVVSHLQNPLGKNYGSWEPSLWRQAFPKSESERLKALLLAGVQQGTGSEAAVSGYPVGGKTGTAEVEGQEQPNALFVGFVDDNRYPLSIAVVVENSGYGSGEAAPLAGKLFRLAIERLSEA